MPYLICPACRLRASPHAAPQASANRCPRCGSLLSLSDAEPPQDTAARWKLFDLRFREARLEGPEHEAR
jgi:transcription initiation factor IIE alpha subunit